MNNNNVTPRHPSVGQKSIVEYLVRVLEKLPLAQPLDVRSIRTNNPELIDAELKARLLEKGE